MECEDKSMERQKLVDGPDEEEELTLPTSLGTTAQSKTPISPPNVRNSDNFHSTHPVKKYFPFSRSIQPQEVIHNHSH